MSAEKRLQELGLTLPAAMTLPSGVVLPFKPVKARGAFAFISGHIAQNLDRSVKEPLGRVGAEVSLEQGVDAARAAGLALLGSLQREIGDLDRVSAWVSAFGMVNASQDFHAFPTVINGFSDLIFDLLGSEIGSQARSAIGVAGLPFNAPVEIEAVVEIRSQSDFAFEISGSGEIRRTSQIGADLVILSQMGVAQSVTHIRSGEFQLYRRCCDSL